MSRVAYVNGRWLAQRSAVVNVEDRGYQFGDGVYEVVHVHGGRFVDAERHLSRLDRSLREIRLPEPMGRAALLEVMRELVRRNRVAEGLVYMQVTRGVSRRDHAFPRRPVPPALVMTAKRIPPFPRDIEAWAAAAITSPDLRWARRDIKSTNLLPNVLARQAAREAGAVEAVLYDERTGVVTEGAATSFWIVDEHGALRTSRLGHAILPGCTREALVAELAEAGIAHEEGEFTLDEARRAREAFLTAATTFVRPITRLDGKPVGEGRVGPMARRLFDLFARHVRGGPRNAA
jgi:D-alanine transaminase